MTNEEKILARLDELTAEIREAKRAIRPYVELKEELTPLVNDLVLEATAKLGGLERRFSLEDLGDMLGQLLVSARALADAMESLRRLMEFKKDFEPYSKELFSALVEQLQTTLQGFEPERLQELLKQFVVHMGNLADGLRMLGAMMELKQDAASLSKQAFNEAVARLECMQQHGVFSGMAQVLDMTQRLGARMQEIDFEKVEPVKGVFGMMAALRRPEVQEGLGVLLELATVMSALKQPTSAVQECRRQEAA